MATKTDKKSTKASAKTTKTSKTEKTAKAKASPAVQDSPEVLKARECLSAICRTFNSDEAETKVLLAQDYEGLKGSIEQSIPSIDREDIEKMSESEVALLIEFGYQAEAEAATSQTDADMATSLTKEVAVVVAMLKQKDNEFEAAELEIEAARYFNELKKTEAKAPSFTKAVNKMIKMFKHPKVKMILAAPTEGFFKLNLDAAIC